jgi:hypothetical protein
MNRDVESQAASTADDTHGARPRATEVEMERYDTSPRPSDAMRTSFPRVTQGVPECLHAPPRDAQTEYPCYCWTVAVLLR